MALVITKVTPQGLYPITELLYCTKRCHDLDRNVASLRTRGTRRADPEDVAGGRCAGCSTPLDRPRAR